MYYSSLSASNFIAREYPVDLKRWCKKVPDTFFCLFPLFVKEGDTVRVNTDTLEYAERVAQ